MAKEEEEEEGGGIEGPSRGGPATAVEEEEEDEGSYDRVLVPVSMDLRMLAAASRSAWEAFEKDQLCEDEMDEGNEAGEIPS